jgi:hypothetical protein
MEQKQALQRVLGSRFDEIKVNHPFGWLVVPEIHAESALVRQLRERLVSHRGFHNFSTPGRALRCDFYIPGANLIIEYDERQHFTEPRALTLELYPSLSLGFDPSRWLNACREIRARDNDPAYRDEQRAFYDALRDILSQANGTQVIRIKHGDWDWRRPDSGQHLTNIFRQLGVQEGLPPDKAKTQSRVEVRYEEEPRLARLVIAGGWDGDVTLARKLLKQVCAQWPTVARPHCLVTCGAFLRFAWPEGLLPGNFLAPDPETVEGLRDAAERVVRDLLDSELVLRLRQVTKYLTLGVDSPLRNKVTTTGNRITSPHIELVCIVDLGAEPFRLYWTGKSYPTNSQADRLVRITDLTSHFTTLSGIGEVLILGCHDLTMFNPRARANAQGWRQRTWKSFEAIAKARKPVAVLHHPHTTVKTRTWSQAWNGLRQALPSVEMYVGAGRYQEDERKSSDYDSIYSILEATKHGPTLDFVAYVE